MTAFVGQNQPIDAPQQSSLINPDSVPSPAVAGFPRLAARRLPGSAPTNSQLLPERRWIGVRLVADFGIAAVASFLGLVFRFGFNTVAHASSQALLGASVPLAWVACLAVVGAYTRNTVSSGGDEYTKVINATAWMIVAGAFASYALKADFSRAFVFGVVPAIGCSTVIGRRAVRGAVSRRLASGAALHRALLVGPPLEVEEMTEHVSRDPGTGFQVCGVLATVQRRATGVDADDYVDLSAGSIIAEAGRINASTIAITSSVLTSRELRELSWQLEGRGIRLLLVPSLFEVAGPRVAVSGLEGLPLLDIREPAFAGPQRVVKEAMDRSIALTLLVMLSPLLLLIAVVVLVADGMPVFYSQERIGLQGRRFRLWKFRTMRVDAHDQHAALLIASDRDVMLKLINDPRVTHTGRFLRRYSLDELPQLLNVIGGSMSLVGPRPPLASEVARYDDAARRRLLVKPGMTGLWQVSGRSNLSWEQTIRLDLHYVENWSVGRDVSLMARTLRAVLSRRGAY